MAAEMVEGEMVVATEVVKEVAVWEVVGAMAVDGGGDGGGAGGGEGGGEGRTRRRWRRWW